MEPDSTDSSTSTDYTTTHSSPLKESDKRRRIQETMEATPPLSSQQLQLYRIVYEDLRKQSTVGWHNAVNFLETVHAHIDQPESQEYLQLCFHQVLCIMLDQFVSKMAPTEKNCVIRTLTRGTAICIAQIQRQKPLYFSHVALILNKKKHFYKEFRSSQMMGQYWNKTSGCPEVRLQCLNIFHEHHGFSMLTQVLEQSIDAERSVSLLKIVPMDDLRILLIGVFDIRAQMEATWIARLSNAVMQLLLILPAVELKKEPTDSIGQLLQTIQRMWEPEVMQLIPTLQETLLHVISRFIDSASLPQRLFGFEQLGHLVQAARQALPLPPSYEIIGAGSPIVNGVYNLVVNPNQASGTYIKHDPINTNPNHPMTLFCCTMKSGSKMWFLSEADQIQPGTDQDIDYYHHQTNGEDTIPPLTHWIVTGRGASPSPLLIPTRQLEQNIDSSRLDRKVLAYATSKKLLDEIFGDRMHREIVSRSTSLLKFLSETNFITTKTLQCIWLSASGKEETLVSEIYMLLVTSVLVNVSDEQLISFLSDLQNQPAADVNSFMEKMASQYRAVLYRPSPEVTWRCLRLIWMIQKKQNDSSQEVLDFFHEALQSHHGQQERLLFVKECIESLRLSERNIKIGSEEEASITRSLELLKLLLESSDDPSIVDKLNSEYNLVQLLFDELATFVQRDTPESALRHRLDLIHYIHGKSPSLELTQAQVRSLWNVLSRGVYKDLCWMFLRDSSVFVQELAPFNIHVCETIFNDLLCNPRETDFSTLSERGFSCFLTYFIGLNAHHHRLIQATNGTIRRIVTFESLIGIDALWEIAIYGLPEVSKLAIAEILNVYIHIDDRDKAKSTLHFLQHVFDVLKSTSTKAQVVQHCVQLLTGHVSQSPPTSLTQHGKRGRGCMLSIQCMVQRIPTSLIEKIQPFVLNISSNETLGTLRQLVESQLHHPLTQTKLLCQGTTLIGDLSTLDQFPMVTEVKEISVVLFQTHVTKDVEKLPLNSEVDNSLLGPMLASNEEYFDILFHLMDKYADDLDTHSLVRDFVSIVPTQRNLLELVSHPLESTDSLQQWLAHASSYHKAIYVLEIIDGCLMPVQGNVAPQYISAFVLYGLESVLQFLFESRVNEHGMEVAIRIVKYCLLEHIPTRLTTIQMEALMSQLNGLVLNTTLSPQIVIDALQIMQSISIHVPFQLPNPWSMECTLLHPEEQIRAQWLITLQNQSNVNQLIRPCFYTLKNGLHVENIGCSEFFELIAFLVPSLTSNDMEELEQHILGMFEQNMSKPLLFGTLTILQTMCQQNTLSTHSRQKILDVVYDRGLFASGSKCLCGTPETRKAAYSVVAQLATYQQEELHFKLSRLIGTTNNSSTWGQECNVIARGRDEHVGLKNQGCSCYMNSFLQQLFMYEPIRYGLLAAEIPFEYPETPELEMNLVYLLETNPFHLIGRRIMNEANNGRTFEAQIIGYDEETKMHTIKYDEGGNDIRLKLGNKDTMSRVTLLPPLLNGDPATVEVLRQVQRTFWYLKESEMRYYNPKALVEACKCLNLEFSVYQQNDASEFCDKLLDRLEIGLSKTPQGAACLQSHLGGKLISQKLPKGCGHRYEREEAFIRLELQIRGKESIEESLAGFVEGELMDGDNKVECELCGEKKAAIRRTCFGSLPKLLILHLKRFDLDYATFETVKLNNRCSFPLELNMKPYTKIGLEENNEQDIEMDDSEYDYLLRGVLVHAGVAQGGHYYSFIYDQSVGKWFKYDDEDVSPFDPVNIEAECFGGMQKRTSSWNGVNNTMEMEVYSNALMLFYEKVEKNNNFILNNKISLKNPMAQQVWKSNELFLRHSYIFDTAFHEFIYDIVTKWLNKIEWLQLGMQFVLDIVLHSREKKNLNRWTNLFNDSFRTCNEFSKWFLKSNMSLYFTDCPDPIARQTVVHFLTSSASFVECDDETLIQLSENLITWCKPPFVDDYFNLIHNIAKISPSIREILQKKQMISRLIHIFLGPKSLPPLIQEYGIPVEAPLECQSLFEAIGSLLGLSKRTTEPLLESFQSCNSKVILSQHAKTAFTELFNEYCIDGIMGVKELQKYFRGCGTTIATAKQTAKTIKIILTKWPQVNLNAFLSYYTELASTNTKQVLNDLRCHGYLENLKRQEPVETLESVDILLENLPPLCRFAIVDEIFLDNALEEDPESVSELLIRLSLGCMDTCKLVIKSILTNLYHCEIGWKGQTIVDISIIILNQIINYMKINSLIELIFQDFNYSIFNVINERKKLNYEKSLFLLRYIIILIELYKIKNIEIWLNNNKIKWKWLYEWLRYESLKPNLGGRINILYRDPNKLEILKNLGNILNIPYKKEEKSYIINNAGYKPINGIYKIQDDIHDNCPIYSMLSDIDHIEYTLFRCEMPSKTHRWYISHCENHQSLGTISDIDYYYCLCTIHDDTPPIDGWKCWGKNSNAIPPLPNIQLYTCTINQDYRNDDMDENTIEYDDSEDELRVSNERFQAVHLESPGNI